MFRFFKVILVAGIVFASGCIQLGNGTLSGKITIGPLCPVERNPPDLSCQPTNDTYKAWPIAVWTIYKTAKIAELQPTANGSYAIELPAGNYVVDLENHQRLGTSGLPTNIVIRQGETTTLNIDIDTGIR